MDTRTMRMREPALGEMRQKSRTHDSFFGLKNLDSRPTSIATEIVDTEWDEEDILSEIEDDDPNSPRVSLNSSGQRSITTLSSYEEAQTPRSSRLRDAYPFDLDSRRPVQGPRGPHLFRSSTTSSNMTEYQEALSLSPITPKTVRPYDLTTVDLRYPLPVATPTQDPLSQQRSRSSPFQFTHESLSTADLAIWAPEQVAQWMLNAGVELSVAEKFVENDINGAILITLKFEDLRELSIPSFGVRTKLWGKIHELKDNKEEAEAAAVSQQRRCETPIEEDECREVRRERRRDERAQRAEDPNLSRSQSRQRSKSVKRSQSRKKPSHEDIISPLESVSIVGIEQVIPQEHHCSKGENCKKWRKQQRLRDAFQKEHPFVNLDKGGIIMLAGNPGNPETAPALNRPSSTEVLRPFSDAVNSMVASSDVLGTTVPPFQYLQEAVLRGVQARDPQDNVRQFLDFQHQHGDSANRSSEVPPTPPFEILPNASARATPHEGLRALPKLSIPGQQQHPQQTRRQSQQHIVPPSRPATTQPFMPYRMDKAEALSPDLLTPTAPYRFGTPFSDMDVPLTAVPIGPIARDASQSVPPDMGYRAAPVSQLARSASRTSRRPSFQVMPALRENGLMSPVARDSNTTPKPVSPRSPPRSQTEPLPTLSTIRNQPHHGRQPLQAPPRQPFPFSQSQRSAFDRSLFHPSTTVEVNGINVTGTRTLANNGATAVIQDAEGVTYQGPVRKRKTRMLRHEWHDQYAVLKGTRLALHRDVAARDRTLEYIDIDDYAIACSSLSATTKLSAAFKAMSISRKDGKMSATDDSVAAFSFQLIPQDTNGRGPGARLRKRESFGVGGVGGAPPTVAIPGNGPGPNEATNSTGKTHHFAVRSRDERIDWMRELMLAKALKQKGEGFEISVNGNMI